MAKKCILAFIIIFILAIFIGIFLIDNNSVDVYIDGENITTSTHNSLGNNIDTDALNNAICNYTLQSMNQPNTNIDTLKSGINDICLKYGLDTDNIHIDSSLGKNSIPVIFQVDGTSMVPTLQDKQDVLVNKTQNVHVGDIVVANSSKYGNIIKRVDQVNNNQIHLVSDNKNVEITEINGVIYETKGISTWVDSSDIYGVVMKY
ncbi:S24/S26 family peptidase [uncultured Methanobrevibacter sp.]|uniref:S24/S26 family peptidase n=1 Tax=uncultured Methanobrevibacter sp. TaxID=253161 RepID=UPI0026385ECD|nr:S24/S26 family peptidase [uncultured Methanobrevibacter sp.]